MFIRNMRAHVSAYQSDVIGLQDRLLDSQNKLIRAQERQSSTLSHSRTESRTSQTCAGAQEESSCRAQPAILYKGRTDT